MRLVYMGTPDIAVPALEALIEAGHDVAAVVTQPDRAQGRHKELVPPPVKAAALAHGIPVLQPEKASDPDFIEELRIYKPESIVVMAYGQILKKSLLELPPLGCINIHASLLPKYRGAAPIQAAILAGEEMTGVTTMFMDEGLDTGDMLLKETVNIDEAETAETLEVKLALAGGRLIVRTLDELAAGRLEREKQDDAASTYVKMIRKEEGQIDWNASALDIERRIRAFYPWPGTYTWHNGGRIKIYAAYVMGMAGDAPAGTVVSAADGRIIVACGEGALNITSLQSEGKKRMDAADFLRGYRLSAGDRFTGKE
ncbi:MAG: methionyl-tRNA formyltransferase [Lachnospiraceae bacterium]|nr:methionyl-tRNA formyltransferase [Lachnospiraceae bacterium]